MDWMTAPVDGLQFSKFVRFDDDSPDIFTPIILMPGHTEQWRVNMARDAGVNEFLAKPISAKTLYVRLLAVIEKPRPFVRTKSYFGPCHRRVNSWDYDGPERRFNAGKADPASEINVPNEAGSDELLNTLYQPGLDFPPRRWQFADQRHPFFRPPAPPRLSRAAGSPERSRRSGGRPGRPWTE